LQKNETVVEGKKKGIKKIIAHSRGTVYGSKKLLTVAKPKVGTDKENWYVLIIFLFSFKYRYLFFCKQHLLQKLVGLML